MRTIRAAVLAAGIVVGGGCQGSAEPGDSPPPRAPATGAATLTVQNNNWLDVAVFLVVGGGRTALLRVGTNGTTTVDLPRNLVMNGVRLRLLADFVGSVDDYWSEWIFLRPGQQLHWTLENDLQYSTLWIY